MPLVPESDLAEALARLDGWARDGASIRRTFEFASFEKAIAFVNAVAELAEAADHHPDIDIRYTEVRLELSTHSAGGLTRRDFRLAERIDRLPR